VAELEEELLGRRLVAAALPPTPATAGAPALGGAAASPRCPPTGKVGEDADSAGRGKDDALEAAAPEGDAEAAWVRVAQLEASNAALAATVAALKDALHTQCSNGRALWAAVVEDVSLGGDEGGEGASGRVGGEEAASSGGEFGASSSGGDNENMGAATATAAAMTESATRSRAVEDAVIEATAAAPEDTESAPAAQAAAAEETKAVSVAPEQPPSQGHSTKATNLPRDSAPPQPAFASNLPRATTADGGWKGGSSSGGAAAADALNDDAGQGARLSPLSPPPPQPQPPQPAPKLAAPSPATAAAVISAQKATVVPAAVPAKKPGGAEDKSAAESDGTVEAKAEEDDDGVFRVATDDMLGRRSSPLQLVPDGLLDQVLEEEEATAAATSAPAATRAGKNVATTVTAGRLPVAVVDAAAGGASGWTLASTLAGIGAKAGPAGAGAAGEVLQLARSAAGVAPAFSNAPWRASPSLPAAALRRDRVFNEGCGGSGGGDGTSYAVEYVGGGEMRMCICYFFLPRALYLSPYPCPGFI